MLLLTTRLRHEDAVRRRNNGKIESAAQDHSHILQLGKKNRGVTQNAC